MSASWIFTLVALVLTGVGGRAVVQQRAQAARTTAEIRRLRAIIAENARMAAALETLEVTTVSVEVTNSIVQQAHHAIANIPFGILEAIPATAPVTRVVHEIHDTIADGVYGTISGVSRALRGAPRRRRAPERPRYDADRHPSE
ncbi:MAG: hypothetical protein LLG14_11570 [Nocardiaceae bacterium]|nr:hypothetical protein [Nocardiaceae bacterium]